VSLLHVATLTEIIPFLFIAAALGQRIPLVKRVNKGKRVRLVKEETRSVNIPIHLKHTVDDQARELIQVMFLKGLHGISKTLTGDRLHRRCRR
jgi:hypothetical protein